MRRLERNSIHIASRRLVRAVALLSRAGPQLDNASRFVSARYNADRLRSFATGLPDLSIQLSLATQIEKGGEL